MPAVVVSQQPDQNRFEIRLDGALAGFIDYQMMDGAYALLHTEVLPEFGGRGVGSELVVQSLEQIREQGKKMLPYCSFIPKVLADHPEFNDVVAAPFSEG